MMIGPTGDAVGCEAGQCLRIDANETRMSSPEAKVLLAIEEGPAEDRVERVVAGFDEHAHRERGSVRRCPDQLRGDHGAEPMTDGQDIVDVEVVEQCSDVSQVTSDPRRR